MMGVNSLPKTVTRQCRACDLNPGLSVPESSTLTTRLPSHLVRKYIWCIILHSCNSFLVLVDTSPFTPLAISEAVIPVQDDNVDIQGALVFNARTPERPDPTSLTCSASVVI